MIYICRMAVEEVFLPLFDKVIWFQNSSMYHFSMFHASHHLEPILATKDEIEAEVDAVKRVTEAVCPLKIVLDQVVLTSTGVLLGLWQVESGTDPANIRSKLREALPQAPQKQLYDPVLLHTSFARILGPPKLPQEPWGWWGCRSNGSGCFASAVRRRGHLRHLRRGLWCRLWLLGRHGRRPVWSVALEPTWIWERRLRTLTSAALR